LPLGALGILMLWFQVLNAHDYYLITLLVVFAFVWLSVFISAKDYRWMKHPLMYVLLLAIFSYNVFTCQKQLSNRYHGWMNDWFVNNLQALGELEPKLQELHIGKNDWVISIPDPSVTASLYFMNRLGYTDFGSDFTKEEEFKKRISQGAKYLIVNDSTILKNAVIQPFIVKPVGRYKNVYLFDLREIKL
jgi:energy-coupling factor transporter transmembrane protein EcfT